MNSKLLISNYILMLAAHTCVDSDFIEKKYSSQPKFIFFLLTLFGALCTKEYIGTIK